MTSLPETDRLDRLVLSAVAEHGPRVALRDAAGQLTYDRLGIAAEATRRALVAAGHAQGEPVLVAVSNSAEDLPHLVGAWLAGATAVPVARSSPAATLRETAARCGAALVVSSAAALPLDWAGEVRLGDEVHSLNGERSAIREELDAGQALVIFTSGSTGQPKGVVLSHATFTGKLRAIQSILPFAPGEVLLQPLHLHFSFGEWTSLLTLATGGTVELVSRFSPANTLRRCEQSVDWMPVVPTMLRMILRVAHEAPAGTLRGPGVWIAGGEPLSAGLGRTVRELFPESGMADVFGLSESCTSDFIVTPDRYDELAGTLGEHPSPGVRHRIVADGRECEPGETGELQLLTEHLMTGYLGDSRATEAAMDGPWLRTGDLAVSAGRGRVQLVGRSKNLIMRGGTKIAPLEVEAAYSGYPGCYGAMAVGVPDGVLHERVHLLLAVAGPAPTLDQVREWGGERLERHKLPDAVHVVDALPLNRTGKVDRIAGRDLAVAAAAP